MGWRGGLGGAWGQKRGTKLGERADLVQPGRHARYGYEGEDAWARGGGLVIVGEGRM